MQAQGLDLLASRESIFLPAVASQPPHPLTPSDWLWAQRRLNELPSPKRCRRSIMTTDKDRLPMTNWSRTSLTSGFGLIGLPSPSQSRLPLQLALPHIQIVYLNNNDNRRREAAQAGREIEMDSWSRWKGKGEGIVSQPQRRSRKLIYFGACWLLNPEQQFQLTINHAIPVSLWLELCLLTRENISTLSAPIARVGYLCLAVAFFRRLSLLSMMQLERSALNLN